jgi:hypothetical protein
MRCKGFNVNTDPLPILVKKLLPHLFATDPTFEIYPIDSWPKEYTAASFNANHPETTQQTKKKSPTLTTADTVPSDFTLFAKYFEYTLHERHPQQTKKTVVRFYSAGSKTMAELRNPATTAFLKANKMWVNSNNFVTLQESTIGWFRGAHPTTTNRNVYQRNLQDLLASAIQDQPEFGSIAATTPDTPNNKRHQSAASSAVPLVATLIQTPTCPPFCIVPQYIGMVCPATNGKPSEYLSAHVLQLRCETVHATLLQNMLARIWDRVRFPDEFIPFSMQEENPPRYLAAIQDLLLGAPSPSPTTVEFDSSADAPPSSHPTIFSPDEPTPTRSSPNNATIMSDPSSAAESATMLATQLSAATINRQLATFPNYMHDLLSSQNDSIYRHFLVLLREKFATLSTHIVKVLAATHLSSTTAALIDHKLATFRTYMQHLLSSQATYRFLELLLPQFDTLSTHIEKVLAQRSRVPYPPAHAPITTLLPSHYPQNTYPDPRHASRDPDTISIRSHSPSVFPIPPHVDPYLVPLLTYPPPPPSPMDPPGDSPPRSHSPVFPPPHEYPSLDPLITYHPPPPSHMDPPGNSPPRLRDG